jgi:hypothetical protein
MMLEDLSARAEAPEMQRLTRQIKQWVGALNRAVAVGDRAAIVGTSKAILGSRLLTGQQSEWLVRDWQAANQLNPIDRRQTTFVHSDDIGLSKVRGAGWSQDLFLENNWARVQREHPEWKKPGQAWPVRYEFDPADRFAANDWATLRQMAMELNHPTFRSLFAQEAATRLAGPGDHRELTHLVHQLGKRDSAWHAELSQDPRLRQALGRSPGRGGR